MKSKKLVSVLLCLIIISTSLPLSASAAGTRTQAEALDWARSQVGICLDYDGVYGAQCIDLIMYYYRFLGADPFYGSGCDYASGSGACPPGWSRLYQAKPQPGDILVYEGGPLDPEGHVAIYESDYVHYHQDVRGYPSGVVKITSWHYDIDDDYAAYWGVIRPAWADAQAPQPISVSFETSGRQSIAQTNASLGCILRVDGAPIDSVSRVGVDIYRDGSVIASKTEAPTSSGSFIDLWYDLNSDLSCFLVQGTTYQYRFHAVIDGQTYHSDTLSFTTGGAVPATDVTITFDATGGAVSPAGKTAPKGGVYGALPTPTRTGYVFSFWSPAQSGTAVRRVDAQSRLDRDSDHTLYAHWTPRTYTVTFNANGGAVSAAPRTVRYGAAYQEAGELPVPTRTGYVFDGWYTAQNGGSKVIGTTDVAIAADHVLYAHWSSAGKTYTVYLNAGGGTVAPAQMTFRSGQLLDTLPTPAREGFRFLGWYTSAGTGGSKITADMEANDVHTPNGCTFYARWAEDVPAETGGLANFKRDGYYYHGLFQDVNAAHWFAGDVAAAYQLGLMEGTAKGVFSPKNEMTIAQAVTLAVRLHCIYHTGKEFEPYAGTNWYDPYVDYARRNGIISAAYDYRLPVTREEFVHILAKALPQSALEPIHAAVSFADAESITYRADVELLCRAGVITGYSRGGRPYFDPLKTITRAEVSAIIARMALPERRVR